MTLASHSPSAQQNGGYLSAQYISDQITTPTQVAIFGGDSFRAQNAELGGALAEFAANLHDEQPETEEMNHE